MHYKFRGLMFGAAYVHGGAYFRNFALFYSNTGLVLDLQWLLHYSIFQHKDTEVNIQYLESTVMINIFFIVAPLFWKSWRGFKQLPAMEWMNNKIMYVFF